MAQTELIKFEVAGKEVRSPFGEAGFMTLQRATADIEVRFNGGTWVLFSRGSRITLPGGEVFRDIIFRSSIEQEVLIGADVIVDGGTEILGTVQVENIDAIRQIEINGEAQSAISNAVERVLNPAGEDGAATDYLAGLINEAITDQAGLIVQAIADNASGGDVAASLVGSQAVGAAPSRIANDEAGRDKLMVYAQEGGTVVYLGHSNDVTAATGIPVAPGFMFEWPGAAEVWAVAPNGATVRIVKVVRS